MPDTDEKASINLYPREREILQYVKKGLTNAEIGKILFISQNTVKTHLKNASRKLSAHGRVNLVVRAVEEGLLEI